MAIIGCYYFDERVVSRIREQASKKGKKFYVFDGPVWDRDISGAFVVIKKVPVTMALIKFIFVSRAHDNTIFYFHEFLSDNRVIASTDYTCRFSGNQVVLLSEGHPIGGF